MTPKETSTSEPTNRDLLEVMNARFLIVDQRLIALNERMNGMDSRLTTLDHRFGKMEVTMLDIQDGLTAALAAVDADAVTLIEHKRRLKRLEAKN